MKTLRFILKIIIVLIIINIVVITGYFIKVRYNKNNINNNETVVVDKIDSFNYVLDNDQNELYKLYFEELKNVLLNKEIIYEDYAKALSKLFVSDLFTLSNKLSSSDIGGVEFVFKDFQKDFLSIAKTTLYKSVKSNLYGERVQELPTVKEVLVDEIRNIEFKYKDKTFDNSFSIKLSISYEKDLGYQNECEIILIKNDNILEVSKLG